MALTKADMAEMLFDELGLNKREAKEIVEHFFEEVKVALETGHQVKLSGFGNFLTRSKAERPGRNPKTGDPGDRKGEPWGNRGRHRRLPSERKCTPDLIAVRVELPLCGP